MPNPDHILTLRIDLDADVIMPSLDCPFDAEHDGLRPCNTIFEDGTVQDECFLKSWVEGGDIMQGTLTVRVPCTWEAGDAPVLIVNDTTIDLTKGNHD